MLDLGLFRERAFAAPVLSDGLNFICTSSIVFLMPLYLLLGRGLSPAEAGLILISQPLMMASITILSGSPLRPDRLADPGDARDGHPLAGAVPALAGRRRRRRCLRSS